VIPPKVFQAEVLETVAVVTFTVVHNKVSVALPEIPAVGRRDCGRTPPTIEPFVAQAVPHMLQHGIQRQVRFLNRTAGISLSESDCNVEHWPVSQTRGEIGNMCS
jgi:hypothetical protein